MTGLTIMAYVRPHLASRVVQALLDAGCTDLFFDERGRVLPDVPKGDAAYSVQIGQKVEPMIRLEASGHTDEVEHWARVVRETGTTGRHGDGIVIVVAVAQHFHLSGAADAPRPSGPEPGQEA